MYSIFWSVRILYSLLSNGWVSWNAAKNADRNFAAWSGQHGQMAWDGGWENSGFLTCWFWSELVPVGSAHGQEPVAQVQVVALLCCYAADHLNTTTVRTTSRLLSIMVWCSFLEKTFLKMRLLGKRKHTSEIHGNIFILSGQDGNGDGEMVLYKFVDNWRPHFIYNCFFRQGFGNFINSTVIFILPSLLKERRSQKRQFHYQQQRRVGSAQRVHTISSLHNPLYVLSFIFFICIHVLIVTDHRWSLSIWM